MKIKRIDDLPEGLKSLSYDLRYLEYNGKDYEVEGISSSESLYPEFKTENVILASIAVFERESGLEVHHNVFLESLTKNQIKEGIENILANPSRYIGND